MKSLELINGHRYLVDRDAKGKVLSMEGRDALQSDLAASARGLLAKPAPSWTLSDVAAALQEILRRMP